MKCAIVFACVLVCALAVPVPDEQNAEILVEGVENQAEAEELVELVRKVRQQQVDIEVIQGKI